MSSWRERWHDAAAVAAAADGDRAGSRLCRHRHAAALTHRGACALHRSTSMWTPSCRSFVVAASMFAACGSPRREPPPGEEVDAATTDAPEVPVDGSLPSV